jgi:serine/threonine protein kinase
MQASPFIVIIFEVVVEPKRVHLIMEYAEHGALS